MNGMGERGGGGGSDESVKGENPLVTGRGLMAQTFEPTRCDCQYSISDRVAMRHEGNIEEEINGYVVFQQIQYIRISWELKSGCQGPGGRRYSSRPHLFLQQASGHILKDDERFFLHLV